MSTSACSVTLLVVSPLLVVGVVGLGRAPDVDGYYVPLADVRVGTARIAHFELRRDGYLSGGSRPPRARRTPAVQIATRRGAGEGVLRVTRCDSVVATSAVIRFRCAGTDVGTVRVDGRYLHPGRGFDTSPPADERTPVLDATVTITGRGAPSRRHVRWTWFLGD